MKVKTSSKGIWSNFNIPKEIIVEKVKSFGSWYFFLLLVSTCERLSVMQRQARFPEYFDQIAKNTNSQFDYPRPPTGNENLARSWHFEFWPPKNTPSPENWNLGRSWYFEFWLPKNTTPPENSNLRRSWHFEFWLPPYPPEWEIEIGQDVCGD